MDAQTNGGHPQLEGRTGFQRLRDKWDNLSGFDQLMLSIVIAVVIAATIVVAIAVYRGATGTTSTGAPSRAGLVAGTEAPFGAMTYKAITDVVAPLFKKVEDAQTKTDKEVVDLGKRVTTLEVPPKPFDYNLYYEYAVGKRK